MQTFKELKTIVFDGHGSSLTKTRTIESMNLYTAF